ncbi:MAG TPA: sialidase family protein [Bryobacteraceae bacterium]|nr:sialidase family protein [Bryobacteraceae bacterium]
MPLKHSRRTFLITSASSALLLAANPEQSVQRIKTPNGGLQPQAVVDAKGVIHLIYLYGDPGAADIGYVRKSPGDQNFSAPIRVNDHPGSAIARGAVRGAHLALGQSGRIHVAWNGSAAATPKGPRNSAPMLYTRLNDAQDRFEPQRNVMTSASGLDGGGTLAADARGNVYIAWHAQGQQDGRPIEGEEHRRVWMARSPDDGRTFAAERPVSASDLGACGCCGMGAVADEAGHLYLLYRSARETVHRDMYLLVSRDQGGTFQAIAIHPWQVGACPMSTVSLASQDGRVLLSWETAKQVYFATVDSRSMTVDKPIAAPGEGNNRKHPALAINRDGQTLLAWTEGTAWKQGGTFTWQIYDEAGKPLPAKGVPAELPALDFATAVPTKSGFLVIG